MPKTKNAKRNMLAEVKLLRKHPGEFFIARPLPKKLLRFFRSCDNTANASERISKQVRWKSKMCTSLIFRIKRWFIRPPVRRAREESQDDCGTIDLQTAKDKSYREMIVWVKEEECLRIERVIHYDLTGLFLRNSPKKT